MTAKVDPLCPYFGACGGCAYQDLNYEEELSLKESRLRTLLQEALGLSPEVFFPIIGSPTSYHYRSRLDLSFRRSNGSFLLGFMGEGTHRIVSIDSCAIARPEISTFLPQLKELASERLPGHYKSANLVVRTGEEGKVKWGGIGRGSLGLPSSDYFWTEIEGKKIFYSLNSFFQANLAILPIFIKTLRSLLALNAQTSLLDLYAGVGLFGVLFAREAREVWAVEENPGAVQAAQFNCRFHQLSQVFLRQGKTEDCLQEIWTALEGKPKVAIVDPPRKGLGPALEKLIQAKTLGTLVYISCHPPSLLQDLQGFLNSGWRVDRVIPFDFFPRTRHLEVVVRLRYDTF